MHVDIMTPSLNPPRRIRVTGAILLALASHGGSASGAGAGSDAGPVLEILPAKHRAYLGEKISLTVTLLADPAGVRDVLYPRLASEAFRVAEFSPPRRRMMVRDGRELVAYEFATTLDPVRSGEIPLGPAELRCDLLTPAGGGAAFFGGGEPQPITLRSEAVRMSILPLPTRGRPADFSGVVGRFSVSRQVVPAAVSSGDPVTVTTRIGGVGNIDSYACPSISLPNARSYPITEKRSDDHLICEQVILPAEAVEIPPAIISYFDPGSGRYRTSATAPLRIDVLPAETPPTSAPTVHVGAPPTEPPRSGRGALVAITVGFVLLMVLLDGFLLTRRSPSVEGPPAAAGKPGPEWSAWLAEADRALAANDGQGFYLAAFRLAQIAVASAMMENGGRTPSMPPRLEEIFGRCDAVRYGLGVPDMREMHAILEFLRRPPQ